MPKVVLVRCESYKYDEVNAAVRRGMELLGGSSNFIKKGEKVLLKPNFLAPEPPEKCVTTHPAVFKAVAEFFIEAGAELSYGDSPAFQTPEAVARISGIAAEAAGLDIPLADFKNGRDVVFDKAVQNKKLHIAEGVLDCDAVISLPKLKTHGFQKMTGCIKNQFGYIPGLRKTEYHVKTPEPEAFARMLVDLNMFKKPRLFIMDGIMAMEGNGPRGGNLKKMNVLIFSSDPVALDASVCMMIGLEPSIVPTVKAGMEAGLGSCTDIEFAGDALSEFTDKSFDINRNPVRPFVFSGGMVKFAKNLLVPRPYIIPDKCTRCGTCVKICPVSPKAVDWHDAKKDRPPSYKYQRCIRCYCCQEICPESAISLRVPFIRTLIGDFKSN